MNEVSPPTVLDTTVLSNFASTDAMSILTASLPRPETVPAVESEVEKGLREGYTFLQPVRDAFEASIQVSALPSPVPESIVRPLDPGEAEAVHLASETGGTFVSDDRDARTVARERGIPVTGSIGVLARAVVAERIDLSTADDWLRTWDEEYGYHAPVETMADVLPQADSEGNGT